jgi:DNA-binding NtrC family response regulator
VEIRQSRFLEALMQIQNVQRGSLWIRRGDGCICSEATGPMRDKVGLFKAARGGTVFLDEIGDMPLGRNMNRCVESGLFREDLYFRLNVLPLVMPPLRNR